MTQRKAMSEQFRAVHPPSRRSNGVEQRVAGVAAALADRADELVDPLADGAIREGRQSGLVVVVPHDRRVRSARPTTPARSWPRRRLNAEAFPARRAVSRYATIRQRGRRHGTERRRARTITCTFALHRGDVEQKVDET